MYSKEDRNEAVNFYLNHAKNISVTVRELDYPCRSVLSNWICEDVENHQPCSLKGQSLVKYTIKKKRKQLH